MSPIVLALVLGLAALFGCFALHGIAPDFVLQLLPILVPIAVAAIHLAAAKVQISKWRAKAPTQLAELDNKIGKTSDREELKELRRRRRVLSKGIDDDAADQLSKPWIRL